MITEVKADILDLVEAIPNDTGLNVVVHGCNAHNTMGSGIAKAIANHYPMVYDADKRTKSGDRSKMGNYSYANVKPNVIIANAYSQFFYGKVEPVDKVTGRQTDYQALESALIKIRDDFTRTPGRKVRFYIPKFIGQSLAKGDPYVIQPMVKEIFKDHELVLFYN